MTQTIQRMVVVESLYYREQFDDWVGGGQLKVGSATCLWRAHNNLTGFGWDVEPVALEQGWSDLTEEQAELATGAIVHALQTHRCEYTV